MNQAQSYVKAIFVWIFATGLTALGLVFFIISLIALIDPVGAKAADDTDPFGTPPGILESSTWLLISLGLILLGGLILINYRRFLKDPAVALRDSMPFTRASEWDSMVQAASEELLDDKDLSATIPLKEGVTFSMVVLYILEIARTSPDLQMLLSELGNRFGLQKREAIIAIDRTLGGVVRASTGKPEWTPDSSRDPFAWQSFQFALADQKIVLDIFPELKRRYDHVIFLKRNHTI